MTTPLIMKPFEELFDISELHPPRSCGEKRSSDQVSCRESQLSFNYSKSRKFK